MTTHKHHPVQTRYGFKFKCNPPNGAKCIPLSDWGEKYFFTFEQIKVMARKGQIEGFRHKGRLYIRDVAPPQTC